MKNALIRPGHVVALCAIALLCVGVVMVNSADLSIKTVSSESPIARNVGFVDLLTGKTSIYMALSILALLGAAMLPVRNLAAWAEGGSPFTPLAGRWKSKGGVGGLFIGCGILTVICALVYVPGLEKAVNGSHRWVRLGGGDAFSFQPSEIAKWGLVVVLAWYCTRRGGLLQSFWKGLTPALIGVGLVAGFIIIEDLGTGALLLAVSTLVLLAGGAKFWHFAILCPAPLAGIILAIMTSEYRVARILAFLDPYKDPEGIGYHTIQSLVAIANGEGTGRGLGFGIQKLGYLPEDRTDFLFAVLCEETGIAGAAAVIFLFAALAWSGLAIARRERSHLLRLITLGIITTVSLQACINLAVVTAMAPTKGIALPLISAGGTGWMLTCFSLGVVIAVDRSRHRAVAFSHEPLPSHAAATHTAPA